MALNFICRYKKTNFASRKYQTVNNNKKNHIKMAEQKNQNEHLNVEDALTQSGSVSYQVQKRNHRRCCCCDYYCSRFYHVQKPLC